jgi:amidase
MTNWEEICHISATELAGLIRARELSAEEVARTYLQRLEAVNSQINAVVQPALDTIERARAADRALAAGEEIGPLHGLPFTVKDVFATPDLVTILDVKIRQRSTPVADATVVSRLRNAGAILLAKTNCPPHGSGFDTENALVGRTLNPYDPTRSPGGSSGGEAALIAAGASPLGLGGDRRGGVRIPAHYCGIAALKPTSGRVPNSGAYNQAGGLTDPCTQTGIMARNVIDLELAFRLISGPDNMDAGVVPYPAGRHDDRPVKELRVAFFSQDPDSPVSAETARAVGDAAQALARAGVQVEQKLPSALVADAREIDGYWQDIAGTPGRDIVELFAAWDYYRSKMLQFMVHYDAILCPVGQHAAPPYRKGDRQRFDYTVPFSLTGYPVVVVRVGAMPSAEPIGVQVVARPWREEVALDLAAILEAEFGGWQSPAP